MELRGMRAWLTPWDRAMPSVKARAYWWQEAQEMVLFPDSAVS